MIERWTNDELVKCKKDGANFEVILLIWKSMMTFILDSNVFQNPNETSSADVWKGKKWMRLTWHHFWCVWKAALEKPGSSDDIAKWICLLYPTNTHSSYLTCFLGKSPPFDPTLIIYFPRQFQKNISTAVCCNWYLVSSVIYHVCIFYQILFLKLINIFDRNLNYDAQR